MRAKHLALVEREMAYPAGHRDGYTGFVRDLDALRMSLYAEAQEDKKASKDMVNIVLAAFDDLPPAEFTSPYPIDSAVLARLGRQIQRKYIGRFKNIRRSWSILLQYMPELMAEGCAPRDVLEMSSAHGATLEVLRHKGHRAVGNDYTNFLRAKVDEDTRFRRINDRDLTGQRGNFGQIAGEDGAWPYAPIIESLGLDVRLFDAGRLPYPFADKSFDAVLCLDAIEHYCHPVDWMAIIDEFTRLARRSVLVITNPVQGHLLGDQGYMEAFHAFQRAMRCYDKGGFQCLHAGMFREQLTVFKLVCVG